MKFGIAIAVFILAAVLAWFWREDGDLVEPVAQVSAPEAAPTSQDIATVMQEAEQSELQPSAEAAEAAAEEEGAGDDPEREFTERAKFHEEARAFFEHASELSPSQRAQQAQDLEEQLALYEKAGELSAGESLLMRIALIKATVAERDQAMRIAELQESYRSDSERRTAAWQARPDPTFELYKARESEIVAEVMRMSTIPDGLTRDEYLRRRLQREREQLFSTSQ